MASIDAQTSKEISRDEPSEEQETCARCGDEIDVAELWEASIAQKDDTAVVKDKAGNMLTPTGAAYCAKCAPDVMLCRKCGCSDEAGCEEGCWWVEAGLCSSCP